MEIEVSLKVRVSGVHIHYKAAIKAKLLELGVHVDDELPDYIMVLVANRRTKQQMESDLELFLSENTIKFTTWLYHVLKKLEQVTLSDPITVPKLTPGIEEGKPSSTSQSKAKAKVKESQKEKDPKTKHSKKDGDSSTSAKVKSTDSTKPASKESEKNSIKKTSEKATSKGSDKATAAEKTSEKISPKSSDKASKKSSEKMTKGSETSNFEVKSGKKGEKHSAKSAVTNISKKSSEKSLESKVQFKLKNNLVKKTEFDRKQEEEERKVESTTKSNESTESQGIPTSTTATEPQQNPDSSSLSIQEDILSLGDDECGDLFGVSGEGLKEPKSKSIPQPDDDDDEENENKLRQIALETKSPNRRKLIAGNVDALRGIVINNEKENSIKRKREKEEAEMDSQVRAETNRSSISKEKEDPPKKLRSVVTITTAAKKPSEEYDPTEPNLHKLSSVVCVTSSQRPKRNTSNMNTNLIFKAMKEVEIENIKRPTSKHDDSTRDHRDDHHGDERDHDRSRRRTRSKSKNRERDRDYADRDYDERHRNRSWGFSDGRRDRNDSKNDQSHPHHLRHERSRSPLQLFTRKNRISIKDRLGERRVSGDTQQSNEMDLELDEEAYDSEIKEIEKDINIVINVSNIRSNSSDGRSVTVESEKSRAEANTEIEVIEEKTQSPIQTTTVELPRKEKGFVAPNRISIRVMNSSDESEESDTEEENDERDEPDEESEDELEVTINEERDIDDLMPPPQPQPQEENSLEKKSSENEGKPIDRLTDLRAKLAALTRPNTASYSPIGFQPRPKSTHVIIDKPTSVPFTPSYFENLPIIVPPTPAPTTCKFWPTCSFGEKCKYIHPKCLYGDSCTKRHMCPYKHETEAFSSLSTFVPPSLKKTPIKYSVPPSSTKKLCLYFPKCHTMDCNFYHPKPCRYGNNCNDPKCIHFHPGSGSIGQLKKGGRLPAIHQLKWSKEKSSNLSEPN